MHDVIEGRKSVLSISLMDNGDYIKIDKDTPVNYSIYDTDGVPLSGYEDITLPSINITPSVLKIPLPMDINTIDKPAKYNLRFIEVSYDFMGVKKTLKTQYRIIPFIPYTVSPSDIRNTLGISENILQDDKVDIYNAYITAKERLPEIDVFLKDFGYSSVKANRVITIQAAVSLKSAIPLLVPRIETDSIASQTRFEFNMDDLSVIIKDLEEELSSLIRELGGQDAEFTPTMFIVGDINDIFTEGG